VIVYTSSNPLLMKADSRSAR